MRSINRPSRPFPSSPGRGTRFPPFFSCSVSMDDSFSFLSILSQCQRGSPLSFFFPSKRSSLYEGQSLPSVCTHMMSTSPGEVSLSLSRPLPFPFPCHEDPHLLSPPKMHGSEFPFLPELAIPFFFNPKTYYSPPLNKTTQ